MNYGKVGNLKRIVLTMLRIIAFSRNCGSGSGKRINGIKGQADDALGSRALFIIFTQTGRKGIFHQPFTNFQLQLISLQVKLKKEKIGENFALKRKLKSIILNSLNQNDSQF